MGTTSLLALFTQFSQRNRAKLLNIMQVQTAQLTLREVCDRLDRLPTSWFHANNLVHDDSVLRLFRKPRIDSYDRCLCLVELLYLVFRRSGKFDRPSLFGGIVARTNTRQIGWLDDGFFRSRYRTFFGLVSSDDS